MDCIDYDLEDAPQIILPILDIKERDDYRSPEAYKSGGFPLNDPTVISKFRSAFRNLIGQVGRQLISGNFNLTNVSFPIKCMS